MLNILKQIGLVSATITILEVIGIAINTYVPWNWLTYLFVIMRKLLPLVDFMIDTNTLLAALGIMLTVQVALWAFKGSNLIIDWLKKY